MRLLRSTVLALALGAGTFAALAVAPPAHASVSIAVAFDSLVKDADTVAIVTPIEDKSVWENGRIYTYTRVKADQGVAGELASGSETWVRTMGGVVGKIGQLVDGEAVFTSGKRSLLFLHKSKDGATWEVSARAQGQYPVVVDEAKVPAGKDAAALSNVPMKIVRSNNAGTLLPLKKVPTELATSATAQNGAEAKPVTLESIRMASDVLHDRPLDDAIRDVAAAWKRLHPSQAK